MSKDPSCCVDARDATTLDQWRRDCAIGASGSLIGSSRDSVEVSDVSFDAATPRDAATVGEPAPAHRERVLEIVRKHGWNATAFQTLEAGYSYFFHGDACVAYVETRWARVVAGAPIAAPADLGVITDAFVLDTAAVGKRCCFVATEDRFVEATSDTLRSLRIGEQPVWDPRTWSELLKQRKSLREQLRRARAKGVHVRELARSELEAGPVHGAISQIAERWLASRAMAPMDFLLRVDPFTFPSDRRCFVAELDGVVVGFAAVIPVPARAGWFIEDLVRAPNAPNGTTESLVDAVMRWAGRSGCGWLTLGLAPLAGNVGRVLRLARTGTAFLYDFEGLRAFKAKLGPSTWAPIYLSYPRTQSAVASIADVLIAFAGVGRPLRFLLRSALRGPTAVIRAFALLLVPWTILLALAPADAWFGGPWPKWAWVVFDVLLLVGLFRVVRRPTAALFETLAIAVTADALLTIIHAAAWHGRRHHDAFELFLIVVGCVAPALAAIVLWGATKRSAREASASRSL